jgi:hypothetical protein
LPYSQHVAANSFWRQKFPKERDPHALKAFAAVPANSAVWNSCHGRDVAVLEVFTTAFRALSHGEAGQP